MRWPIEYSSKRTNWAEGDETWYFSVQEYQRRELGLNRLEPGGLAFVRLGGPIPVVSSLIRTQRHN